MMGRAPNPSNATERGNQSFGAKRESAGRPPLPSPSANPVGVDLNRRHSMTHANSTELQEAARRALALGYAAIDSPTAKRVREAKRLVVRVLDAIDKNLCGGEIRELVLALKAMSAELTGLEPQPI